MSLSSIPKKAIIFLCPFSGSGYGEISDEDDDEQYDTDSLESALPAAAQKDDNNIYKDMLSIRFVREKTNPF